MSEGGGGWTDSAGMSRSPGSCVGSKGRWHRGMADRGVIGGLYQHVPPGGMGLSPPGEP